MGTLCSRNKIAATEIASSATRKIYVGKVPEIEEDEVTPLSRKWSGRKTTRDSLSHSSRTRPEVLEPARTIVRRNSSVGSASKRRQVQRPGSRRTAGVDAAPGAEQRKQDFCNNYIKTSRYTILTFLPKNLYEQCRRFVNFYFLVITILQYFIDSPESPVSSTVGLTIVLCVTALKQGYEDWIRHRADDAVNNREADVVINANFKKTKSKHLKVGDIIRLEEEDPLPADVLVLSSSDEFHRCQITTANLDGESNLKMRYCPPGLPPLQHPHHFSSLTAVLECEQPNANLYSFNGNLLLFQRQFQEPDSVRSNRSTRGDISVRRGSESLSRRLGTAILSRLSSKPVEEDADEVPSASEFLQIPITMENMLLRGTRLKNTDYVYGLVIYTGEDTRLAQNSKKTNTKFPTADRSINSFLLIIMGFLVFAVTLYSILHFVWLSSDIMDAAWYLPPKEKIDAEYIITISFSFLVVFYYIIPISLYVTIEMQTFMGSKFFIWDDDMKCPDTGAPPLCNTSDLNEELGQIEYLFSDKTGTLTENVMEFRHCSVNGNRYEFHPREKYLTSQHDPEVCVDLGDPSGDQVLHFFRVLALCHTVQVVTEDQRKKRMSGSRRKVTPKVQTFNDEPEFQASSPDELALLQACAALGIQFLSDENEILTLQVLGKVERYKRHYVLEFDADRKCMSVIIENAQKDIWLLTKGAESTIFPRGKTGPVLKSTQHVDDFAHMGLRTLAVAQKCLSAEDLNEFTKQLNKTRRLVHHREDKMRELYRSVESDFDILGATGVEDQLQDGVQETLVALGQAGIRVWVLTGDKVETAVNVAVACGLLPPTSKQMRVTHFNEAEEIKAYLERVQHDETVNDDTTFIIDGDSLAVAFDTCAELFCSVVMKAGRVVCCRLAPLQKAQVVSMVKTTSSKPITAAVGDGANDVAMIQEAHIGLGIFGKEGRQAARSADFALAKFSFLKKAILVHGHWYYVRLATLVLYFFYKNVVLIFPPSLSAFQTAFSSQSLFNAFFMTFFNIFFTSAPILAFALQEQPHPARTLYEDPSLYKKLSRNSHLTMGQFGIWMLRAFWHSLLCYFLPLLVISSVPIDDWASYGVFIVTGVVAVTNMMLVPYTKYITGWILFAYACSFVSYFALTSIKTEVDMPAIGVTPGPLRHTFFAIQEQLAFWLTMLSMTVLALLPDIVFQCVRTPFKRFWKQYGIQPNFKLLPTCYN